MSLPHLAMRHPSLANDKLPDVLRLIRTPNVGPVTFFQLISRFGTAAKALNALPELSLRGGRKAPLAAFSREAAQKEIDATTAFGARMVRYGEADYPALLHAIADAPPIITVLGHSGLWQRRDAVAMVGARNASANGCQFALRLARDVGDAGLLVASGLARGIDTFVHKGSLATGTVAVIAGGIDNIYPPENAELYAKIRDMGAIISEQPFGQQPFSGSFPGRNRIIAGMSLGTVVVEASPKSGSLITARFALEADREVFAVPGSPLDPRSKGCNQLLKQGASMAESAVDILQGIAHLRNITLSENPAAGYTPAPAAIEDGEMKEARRLLLAKLGITPVSVDELVEQCHISASVVMAVLLELELAGRLKRSPGNNVCLTDILEEEVA